MAACVRASGFSWSPTPKQQQQQQQKPARAHGVALVFADHPITSALIFPSSYLNINNNNNNAHMHEEQAQQAAATLTHSTTYRQHTDQLIP